MMMKITGIHSKLKLLNELPKKTSNEVIFPDEDGEEGGRFVGKLTRSLALGNRKRPPAPM